MSSVFVSRGREVHEAARIIQARYRLDDRFIEGHACRCQIDRARPLEGHIYLFEGHFVFSSEDYQSLPLIREYEDVTLGTVTPLSFECFVVDPDIIGTKKIHLKFSDMDRPDEAGRVLHFLKHKKAGKIDERIATALEGIPMNGLYARALARYPQHHHDIFNLFELYSVLHLPEGRPPPVPDMPGDNALEVGDIEAVIGHHIFWGCEVHSLSAEGVQTGKFEHGIIADMVDELTCYVCLSCICIMGSSDPNFPVKLDFQGILSIVEVVVDTEQQPLLPAVRISYISDEHIFNSFVLYHFTNELAFETCLHDLTMAWAFHHNRLYNVGEVFPLLDVQDLSTIVFHFRQLDREGYGIIPKDIFLQSFAPLNIHLDVADLLYGMFDHIVSPEESPEVVQFSRYLLAMRTLLSGPLEDKSDLLFRAFDYQRQGWVVKKEQLYALAVMTHGMSPEIRETYTFPDFNRWLFEQFDKNRDGFLTHQDFVDGICEDPKIRRAWSSMQLSPSPQIETKHPRRIGQRFIHAGHPRFPLICAIQHGIETSIVRYPTRNPDPNQGPFEEMQSYSMLRDQPMSEGDIDYTSSLPTPDWALPLESRVIIKNMERETLFNGKSGSVIGYNPESYSVVVNVHETGQPVSVSPENLTIIRTSLSKDIGFRLHPGQDPGICFQTKPNGLPFVAGLTVGGPSERAGMYPGFVIDRIDGYRMPSKRAIESYMEAWSQSGADQLVYSVILPLDDEHGLEVGSRVEISGLHNAPQYNKRRGVIQLKDDLEAIEVLLDGDDEPVVLQARNILPIGNSIHKKFRFDIPPGGELGMDLDVTRDEGPIFVKSVVPHGPADRCGLPVKSIIESVNGIKTHSPADLVAAIQEFVRSSSPSAIIGAIIPVGGRTLPGEDTDQELHITDYAPEVFADLRSMLNITDEDYLHSISLSSARAGLMTCHLRTLLELRPGAFFYGTHDERFVISGLSKERADALFKMLYDYREHLKKHKDSLLPRYVGLYCLEWHGADMYFAVTLNAFSIPHKDIPLVINITPDEPIEKHIQLAPKALKCLLIQLENDTRLLRGKRSIGYSLVVGVHSVRNEVDGRPIWGADKRVQAASTMLLGNPCFSLHEVLHSYNISRHMEPVFSRKHHTPLPMIGDRHESAKRKISARRRFFPPEEGEKKKKGMKYIKKVMDAEERWLQYTYHQKKKQRSPPIDPSAAPKDGEEKEKEKDWEEQEAKEEKEKGEKEEDNKDDAAAPLIPGGKKDTEKEKDEVNEFPGRVNLPTVAQEEPHLDSEWKCKGCGAVNAWRYVLL